MGTGKSPGEVLRRKRLGREEVDLTPAFDSSRENPRGVDTLLGEQTTNKQDHLFLGFGTTISSHVPIRVAPSTSPVQKVNHFL